MQDVAREVKGRRPAYTCARATFFSAAAHDQVPSQAAPMTARPTGSLSPGITIDGPTIFGRSS